MVIILVRKLLDFVFTRRELKILDDIMPESIKQKREEEKELFKKEAESEISSPGSNTGGLVPNTSSNNVSIPLSNGNILKVPMGQVNISEALSKSDAWRSVNSRNGRRAGGNNKANNTNKKKRNFKKDAKNEEEQKRLSTMREEEDEDDCGITIKIEAPTPIPSGTSGPCSPNDERNGETPV